VRTGGLEQLQQRLARLAPRRHAVARLAPRIEQQRVAQHLAGRGGTRVLAGLGVLSRGGFLSTAVCAPAKARRTDKNQRARD
jgi:hypothetical protein